MRFEHLDLSENDDRVLCIRSRWVAGLRCVSGHYYRVGFVATSQGEEVVARRVGSGEGRVPLNERRPTVGKLASPHARRVASRKPAFSSISYLPPSSRQQRKLETSGTSHPPTIIQRETHRLSALGVSPLSKVRSRSATMSLSDLKYTFSFHHDLDLCNAYHFIGSRVRSVSQLRPGALEGCFDRRCALRARSTVCHVPH